MSGVPRTGSLHQDCRGRSASAGSPRAGTLLQTIPSCRRSAGPCLSGKGCGPAGRLARGTSSQCPSSHTSSGRPEGRQKGHCERSEAISPFLPVVIPANGTSEIAAGGEAPLPAHAMNNDCQPYVRRRGAGTEHRSPGDGPPAPRNDRESRQTALRGGQGSDVTAMSPRAGPVKANHRANKDKRTGEMAARAAGLRPAWPVAHPGTGWASVHVMDGPVRSRSSLRGADRRRSNLAVSAGNRGNERKQRDCRGASAQGPAPRNDTEGQIPPSLRAERSNLAGLLACSICFQSRC